MLGRSATVGIGHNRADQAPTAVKAHADRVGRAEERAMVKAEPNRN
jgi:hypothetical protein